MPNVRREKRNYRPYDKRIWRDEKEQTRKNLNNEREWNRGKIEWKWYKE